MANAKFKNQLLEPQVSELGADGVLKLPKLLREQMKLKGSRKVLMYSLGDTLIVTPSVVKRKREEAGLDDLMKEARKVREQFYKKKYNDLDYLAGTWSDEEVKEFEKGTEKFNF